MRCTDGAWWAGLAWVALAGACTGGAPGAPGAAGTPQDPTDLPIQTSIATAPKAVEASRTCWNDRAVVSNDMLVVRSLNLHAVAGRVREDFDEIVKMAQQELGSAGPGLWGLQETTPGVLCNSPKMDCLGEIFRRSTGDTTATWRMQAEQDESFIWGSPWEQMDGRDVGAGVLRAVARHRTKHWNVRVYVVHGWLECNAGRAGLRRKQVEDVIKDLQSDPPGDEIPSLLLGDFNLSPPRLGGDCPFDEQTDTLLQQYFTQVVPLPWDAAKLASCGVDGGGSPIDQVWVTRTDVFHVRGDLVPRYVNRTPLSQPGTEYCRQRLAGASCQAVPGLPVIPCTHCLSDHPLVSVAFEVTSEKCVVSCAPQSCGDDGCGGLCRCGFKEKCVQRQCLPRDTPACTKPGDLPCPCREDACMSPSSCDAACLQ